MLRLIDIPIERAHIEEDAGKLTHVGGSTGRIQGAEYSMVDYNRAGVPLVEIVTRTIVGAGVDAPEYAKAYVATIRDIVRGLGISEAKMERGNLRCDANISLMPKGLVHAMLTGKGLLTGTTAPVSAGLLTDLLGYTEALTAYREGNARPVVEQFAQAARYAAVTGTQLVDDLAAQLERDRERLAGVRRHALAWRVLPLLVGQPIVNAAHLQRNLGVTAMTAQRALAQLTETGVLTEATGRSRNRVWQHTEILGVLDEYAAQVRRQG